MTSRDLRSDVDDRRITAALRAAVARAPELQPDPDFLARLRDQLRQESGRDRSRAIWRRSWLALAAGLVLAIGLTGGLMMNPPDASADTLAQDAIGDHQTCALGLRLVKMAVPLPEDAANSDAAFRLLLNAPADEILTPGGPVRVVDRHACAYDLHRFGHVIMQYRGHVVSLLMTGPRDTGPLPAADAVPHPIGRSTDGLTVVSVNRSRRAILLVSDLGDAELKQLSTIIATPLARRLEGGVLTPNPGVLTAWQTARPLAFSRRLLARP